MLEISPLGSFSSLPYVVDKKHVDSVGFVFPLLPFFFGLGLGLPVLVMEILGLRVVSAEFCVANPESSALCRGGSQLPLRLRRCEKIVETGRCGCAARCAESLRLSGKRLSSKSLILSLRSERAEPFRTAGGRAAIFSHLYALGIPSRCGHRNSSISIDTGDCQ